MMTTRNAPSEQEKRSKAVITSSVILCLIDLRGLANAPARIDFELHSAQPLFLQVCGIVGLAVGFLLMTTLAYAQWSLRGKAGHFVGLFGLFFFLFNAILGHIGRVRLGTSLTMMGAVDLCAYLVWAVSGFISYFEWRRRGTKPSSDM